MRDNPMEIMIDAKSTAFPSIQKNQFSSLTLLRLQDDGNKTTSDIVVFPH